VSTWTESGWHDSRAYAHGLYGSAAAAGGWELLLGRERVAYGRECLPFSREVCDEAAVAWVLIALAKRAAAWADAVDAALARRYRQTHAALCWGDADYFDALHANREAHAALLRGAP